MDLDPEWDRAFLDVCRSGRVEDVAAYSALSACGDYDVTYEFYRPIKEYIAGFAVTTALLAG